MKHTRFSFVGKVKDIAYLNSFVFIKNNNSVIIENCKQICECSDIYIKVLSGDHYIEIWGKDLSISDYLQDTVEIYGVIDSVKLINKFFFKGRN